MRSTIVALTVVAALVAPAVAADSVKGTLVAKPGGQKITITHAYLVSGPDLLNPGSTVRWMLFTSSDVSERIRKCSILECVDPNPNDGFLVVLAKAPFLMYRHSLNKGGIQHAGPVDGTALKRTTDTAKQLAGTLRFDNAGAAVDVTFDLTLFKTFTK